MGLPLLAVVLCMVAPCADCNPCEPLGPSVEKVDRHDCAAKQPCSLPQLPLSRRPDERTWWFFACCCTHLTFPQLLLLAVPASLPKICHCRTPVFWPRSVLAPFADFNPCTDEKEVNAVHA